MSLLPRTAVQSLPKRTGPAPGMLQGSLHMCDLCARHCCSGSGTDSNMNDGDIRQHRDGRRASGRRAMRSGQHVGAWEHVPPSTSQIKLTTSLEHRGVSRLKKSPASRQNRGEAGSVKEITWKVNLRNPRAQEKPGEEHLWRKQVEGAKEGRVQRGERHTSQPKRPSARVSRTRRPCSPQSGTPARWPTEEHRQAHGLPPQWALSDRLPQVPPEDPLP